MRHLIFALVILFISISEAKKTKLMECIIPYGDYQEVSVYQEGHKLILFKLDYIGFSNETELPSQEWKNQKIKITCGKFNRPCGHVYKSKEYWVYSIGYNGFYHHGFCLR